MKKEREITREDVLREIKDRSRRLEDIVRSLSMLHQMIVELEEVKNILEESCKDAKAVRNQDGTYLSWGE